MSASLHPPDQEVMGALRQALLKDMRGAPLLVVSPTSPMYTLLQGGKGGDKVRGEGKEGWGRGGMQVG
jgi:hypothetical protein